MFRFSWHAAAAAQDEKPSLPPLLLLRLAKINFCPIGMKKFHATRRTSALLRLEMDFGSVVDAATSTDG
jgi:hypothetical protein